MTANVGYWYNAQIRTLILHTQRLFSNFYISNGLNDNGEEDLRRVPCVFMSTDKSALNLINNNTDTVIESSPKMVLTISELRLNNNLISGSPYHEYISDFNEKKFFPPETQATYGTNFQKEQVNEFTYSKVRQDRETEVRQNQRSH